MGDGAGELVCLHPLVGPGSPTFRLYAEPSAAFALDGEIDAAGTDTFMTTLRRIWPETGSGELVIDAEGLEFISHRELLALDQQAQSDCRQILLRGAGPLLTRLAGLLELDSLRLQPA